MRVASRLSGDLVTLAEALAAYECCTLQSLSGRALGKGGFFGKLNRGGDCYTATAERVVVWFDSAWPHDLPWSAEVVRPSRAGALQGAYSGPRDASSHPVLPTPDDAFLARISHLPIWKNGRRPPWWDDMDVRAFLTRSHRQMSTLKAAKIGARKFGDRCPKKSAIHSYWQRLDKLFAQGGAGSDIPRPKSPKKKEAT